MATYWVKSGTGGTDAGTSWANAAESVQGLMVAQAIAAGDIIYIHNTHNFTANTAITWTLSETASTGFVYVYCVDGGDATGASLVDGTVGSLTTGALENTNGNTVVTLNGQFSVHGVKFQAGAGASSSSADIFFASTSGSNIIFNACEFWVNSTNTGAQARLGATTNTVAMNAKFINCKFRIEHTGSLFEVSGGYFEFINCSIDSAGAVPGSAFVVVSGARCYVKASGFDLREATAVVNQAVAGSATFFFSNCAIGTPVTGTNTQTLNAISEFQGCAAVNSASEPKANILSYYYEDAFGVVESDSTVYLTTGGASGEQSDGTDTGYSLKITPYASCAKPTPIYTPWFYVLIPSTGDKTLTIKTADTETDADEIHTNAIWMEVEYMGEPGATGTQRVADSPHAVLEVDDDCEVETGTIYRNVLATGSDRTDTDVAWTGVTETNTYTLTASINCAEIGYLRARVGLGMDTTNPVYIDPKINVA